LNPFSSREVRPRACYAVACAGSPEKTIPISICRPGSGQYEWETFSEMFFQGVSAC
jgi:hypothetical protein